MTIHVYTGTTPDGQQVLIRTGNGIAQISYRPTPHDTWGKPTICIETDQPRPHCGLCNNSRVIHPTDPWTGTVGTPRPCPNCRPTVCIHDRYRFGCVDCDQILKERGNQP